MFKKSCKRCDEMFRPNSKFTKICDSCNKKSIIVANEKRSFKRKIMEIPLNRYDGEHKYAIIIEETKEIVEKFRLKQTAYSVLPKMQRLYYKELKVIDL